MSANGMLIAPAALAKTATAAALAKGATASTSTLTLIKGALKIMAWTKAKTAIAVGVAILLAGGSTLVAVKKSRPAAGGYSWQVFDPTHPGTALPQALPKLPKARVVGSGPNGPSPGDLALARFILSNTPPQVTVVPTRFPNGGMFNGVHTSSWMAPFRNDTAIGMNCSAVEIIQYALGFHSQARTVVEARAAEGGYDFISNLPSGSKEALKAEVEQKLGLTGRIESRSTDVLILKAKTAAATDDLRETRIAGMGASQLWASSTSVLAEEIERLTQGPVVNETGLTNYFSVTLKWNEGGKPTGAEQLNLSLDEIGLELVPANMPIDMLVVGKAN
jgi:hypothetical protein